MIVFEIRKWCNARMRMTSEIVNTFRGESNRRMAYFMCPADCVVWERQE